MSKFCQHPDCPKTTKGLEPCTLCGYPVRRQPKPTDARQLAGHIAITGFLSQLGSFVLISLVASLLRPAPYIFIQIYLFLTLALFPSVIGAGMLWLRRKDIQIVANVLDADKFQREVNHALEIAYPWAVIAGAALLVSLPIIFMKGDYGIAPVPFALAAFSAVSIGIPICVCEFIYSNMLRKYRKPFPNLT